MRKLSFGLVAFATVALQIQSVVAVTVNAGSGGTFTDTSAIDVTGNIVYAIDLGGGGSDTVFGGVTFKTDANPISGVTINTGTTNAFSGGNPLSFTGAGNTALASIVHSMRFGGAENPTITLAVVANQQYQLQLLFWEPYDGFDAAADRSTDVSLTGLGLGNPLVIDDLNLPADLGGTGAQPTTAYLYTYTFTTGPSTTSFTIALSPGSGSDPNPAINALTLEAIPVPEPAGVSMLCMAAIAVFRLARRRK